MVLSNIFEFRQRRRQIFDCLPSIAKIPVDTAQSIAMSPLSFAELFTMCRRYDSSHGIIRRRRRRRRGIDASISPDCRRGDSPNAALLPRIAVRKFMGIDPR
jgi:hypothetical protein